MKLLQTSGLLLLSSLLISLSTFAQDKSLNWDKQVQRGTLDNGLNYYFYHSDKKSDPFNLRLIVHAGSIDEVEVKGVAHAVEHMVFNHTQAHPETVQRYLRQIGWRTGKQINAKTQPSETYYMVRTRPNDALDLKGSLTLLSDIAGNAQFNEAQWRIEQQIITEEKRLGESVVQRLSDQKKQITKANSKYSEGSVAGTYQSIASISFKELKQFYETNYVASNMSLVISGHVVDKKQLHQLINDTFGTLPKRPKPARDHINFPLDNSIKISAIQDKQGSTSRVAVGFRMPMPAKSTIEGVRLHLYNYLIKKLLFTQVNNNRPYFPDSITSISSVIRDAANERLTVAFATNTAEHEIGLTAIFREIERLKRYGITEEALQARLTHAKTVAKRNISSAKSRSFTQWEDKISETIVTGGILSSPEDKFAVISEILDKVTLEEINQRITQMLTSPDMFIYYQAPGDIQLTLPSVQQVNNWQTKLATVPLETPLEAIEKSKAIKEEPAVITMPTLAKPDPASSTIQATKQYPQQAIIEWQLANGNRVVWLNRATKSGNIHFKAITDIGFKNQQQSEWLAQSAIQIYEQSSPQHADLLQWAEWQKKHHAQWQFKLQEQHLDISIVAKKAQLEAVFHAFWLNQQPRTFSDSALKAVKESVTEQLQSNLDNTVAPYLYGTKNDNKEALKFIEKLTIDSLSEEANRLIKQPHTLFIVGALQTETLQNLIATYLAPLQSVPALTQRLQLQRSGHHQFERQRTGHLRSSVSLSARTPMDWSPESAFMLSSLNPVIQQALSQRLRLELGGVYRVKFEMKLNPDTSQVTSEMSFISAPERADELALAAQQVLQNINTEINAMNTQQISEDIQLAEQSRLTQNSTWIRRLMLSYRRYDDPRYLDSMHTLSDTLTHQHLIDIAEQVLPFQHTVQITTQYQPESETEL